MSNPTIKRVTPGRLKELLECYGSSASSWPAEERQAAVNLLKGSPELNALRDQIQPLDDALMEYHETENNLIDPQAVQSLQQRIMRQLPDQQLPESSTAHNDRSASQAHLFRLWAGSIAASIFIASLSFGVINQLVNSEKNSLTPLSTELSNTEPSDTGLSDTAFAQWAWEDITGESLEADSENDPTTLYALVALELPAE